MNIFHHSGNRMAGKLRRTSVYASILLIIAASVCIAGWIFDIRILRVLFIGQFAPRFITSICLLLTGSSLLLFHKKKVPGHSYISWGLAAIALVISLQQMVRYITFISGVQEELNIQANMAPDSSAGIILLASSLLLLNFRARITASFSQVFSLIVLMYIFIPVLCDLYGCPNVFPGFPGMQLETALMFMVAGTGTLFAFPGSGMMSAVTSPGLSGYISKRLLPLSLLLPAVLVWLLLVIENTEKLHLPDHLHLVAAILIISFVFLSMKLLHSVEIIDEHYAKARDNAFMMNRQLRQHIENSPLAMVEWDNQFRVKKWSRQAEEMFGWTYRDVAGKRSDEWHFVHKDDFWRAEIGMKKLLEGRETNIILPLRNFTRDGSMLYCTWYLSVLHDRNGEMISILSLVDNDTEQKMTDMKLAESEQQYRSLVEITQDAIVINQDGRLVFVNPAAVRLFGAPSPEALTGKKSLSLFHEDYHEIIKQRIDKVLRGESVPMIEEKIVRIDGKVIDVEVSANTLLYKGRPAIQVVLRDITARKRSTEILRRNEFLLRMAGYLAQTGGWMVELASNRVVWSDQVAAIHEVPAGFSPDPEEAIGFYAPEYREVIRKAFWTCAREGKSYDVEMEILTPKGNRKWIRNIGVAERDGNGKIINVIGAAQDITTRKKTEEEIRKLNEDLETRVQERTAQLEESNRDLEAFSYSISHDLRTPLRAIDGFTGILLEDHSSRLDEEGKRICRTIIDNTGKMGVLIDELLSFSRVGRQSLNISTIEMDKMALSVYTELTTEPERERINLIIEADCNPRGDQTLIRQVWANLISNAIKFTSKQEKSEITISCNRAEDFYRFCIRDNGVGFDMKYAGRIFDVFYRLHSEREYEGTGVGLAIVQRIIRRHGGDVAAWGEPGRGAEFCFTLPINKQNQGAG